MGTVKEFNTPRLARLNAFRAGLEIKIWFRSHASWACPGVVYFQKVFFMFQNTNGMRKNFNIRIVDYLQAPRFRRNGGALGGR